jgi:hypothetical protein
MLARGARVTRRDFISGRPAAIVGSAIADTPVTGAFVTPYVPGDHALLEDRDVLVVRHGSNPRSVRLVSASLHPFDGTTLLPA